MLGKIRYYQQLFLTGGGKGVRTAAFPSGFFFKGIFYSVSFY
jgi:hypothetical protein